MQTVKLSPDGEILIPKEILLEIAYVPGTEFAVRATNEGLTLTPIGTMSEQPFPYTTKEQLRGFLQGKNGSPPEDDGVVEERIKARLSADDTATRR